MNSTCLWFLLLFRKSHVTVILTTLCGTASHNVSCESLSQRTVSDAGNALCYEFKTHKHQSVASFQTKMFWGNLHRLHVQIIFASKQGQRARTPQRVRILWPPVAMETPMTTNGVCFFWSWVLWCEAVLLRTQGGWAQGRLDLELGMCSVCLRQ